MVALLHWIVYKRYAKGARLCQKCRSMSQGFNEAYDLSEGEEEEKKQKEEEERQKELEAKIEVKKKSIAAKKGA